MQQPVILRTPTTTTTIATTAKTTTTTNSSSCTEEAVSMTIQQGVEQMILQTTVGFLLGGVTGLVLRRRCAVTRKMMAGLGGGLGLGSAWTKTSMDLEHLLKGSWTGLMRSTTTTEASTANTSTAE